MKIKHSLTHTITALFTVFSFGCSSGKVKTTNYSIFLNQSQRTSLSTQASLGNGDAAYKLFEFYFFNDGDKDSALHWLSVAATNGNISAEYGLGMYYSGEIYHDPVDIKNAKYWFSQASANGDTNAVSKLRKLESELDTPTKARGMPRK